VALSKTPVPWENDYRSALQDAIDTLLYAIITGSLAILALAIFAVGLLDREQDLRLLIARGPEGFSAERRIEGVLWLFAYLGAALVAAEAVGNGQLLLRARAIVATLFFTGSDWTHSTIWAWAFEQATRPASPHRRVGVIVTRHSGEVYSGVLVNYPVIADDKEKDFAIAEPRAFNRLTGKYTPFKESPLLLLNSRDCKSIITAPVQTPPRPDPERHPRISDAISVLPWLALIVLAGACLLALIARTPQDALLRLLEAFAVQILLWPVLEFARHRAFRGVRSAKVMDRLWLLATLALVLGLTLAILGASAIAVLIPLVISAVALVLLLHCFWELRADRSRLAISAN
jgi:hypothetical protein